MKLRFLSVIIYVMVLITGCGGGGCGNNSGGGDESSSAIFTATYSLPTNLAIPNGYKYTGNNLIYPLCNYNSSNETCISMANTALSLQNGQWQIITWQVSDGILTNSDLKCTTMYNDNIACANGTNITISNPSNGLVLNTYTFTGDPSINANIGYFAQNNYYTFTNNAIWVCNLANQACIQLVSTTTQMGTVSWSNVNSNVYAYFLTDIGKDSISPLGYYDFIIINGAQATIYQTPYANVGAAAGLAVNPNNTNQFFIGSAFSIQKCNLANNSFSCQTYATVSPRYGLMVSALAINQGNLLLPAVNVSTGTALEQILSVPVQ
ncbi:MAG: hypothetical protein ORN24_05110 [Burkholderiales bacterium]|nr:hypothetical protein [Burkholderiales bacterium]